MLKKTALGFGCLLLFAVIGLRVMPKNELVHYETRIGSRHPVLHCSVDRQGNMTLETLDNGLAPQGQTLPVVGLFKYKIGEADLKRLEALLAAPEFLGAPEQGPDTVDSHYADSYFKIHSPQADKAYYRTTPQNYAPLTAFIRGLCAEAAAQATPEYGLRLRLDDLKIGARNALIISAYYTNCGKQDIELIFDETHASLIQFSGSGRNLLSSKFSLDSPTGDSLRTPFALPPGSSIHVVYRFVEGYLAHDLTAMDFVAEHYLSANGARGNKFIYRIAVPYDPEVFDKARADSAGSPAAQ